MLSELEIKKKVIKAELEHLKDVIDRIAKAIDQI
jgi:hypothetical protein